METTINNSQPTISKEGDIARKQERDVSPSDWQLGGLSKEAQGAGRKDPWQSTHMPISGASDLSSLASTH